MGYFRSIPYELEQYARIDGATRWHILVKIILPLAVPGLVSAAIFSYVAAERLLGEAARVRNGSNSVDHPTRRRVMSQA